MSPVDGAYDYTQDDLKQWDNAGPGEAFKKYYAEYYDLAVSYGLDPAEKPTIQDISETKHWLHYQPTYSLRNVLDELSRFGVKGPPCQ